MRRFYTYLTITGTPPDLNNSVKLKYITSFDDSLIVLRRDYLGSSSYVYDLYPNEIMYIEYSKEINQHEYIYMDIRNIPLNIEVYVAIENIQVNNNDYKTMKKENKIRSIRCKFRDFISESFPHSKYQMLTVNKILNQQTEYHDTIIYMIKTNLETKIYVYDYEQAKQHSELFPNIDTMEVNKTYIA